MKKVFYVTSIFFVVFLLSGCGAKTANVSQQSTGGQQQGIPNQTAVTVNITNFTFDPEVITIKKGASVTWVNNDAIRHTATADDGFFDSSLLAKGESFSFTFDNTGTYAYHCTPHPAMKGQIIVVE